jgi:hypothetical protein
MLANPPLHKKKMKSSKEVAESPFASTVGKSLRKSERVCFKKFSSEVEDVTARLQKKSSRRTTVTNKKRLKIV